MTASGPDWCFRVGGERSEAGGLEGTPRKESVVEVSRSHRFRFLFFSPFARTGVVDAVGMVDAMVAVIGAMSVVGALREVVAAIAVVMAVVLVVVTVEVAAVATALTPTLALAAMGAEGRSVGGEMAGDRPSSFPTGTPM